ncbi:PREDICTED: rab3 GTPase-activating protein non-catalytic subunit-like [Priapulus caudatus]|uniref:Rab3 GTPase-activating protein non-catalytic subunit-like n=1 Tax=Priapulus caudatus TaxID=37621 RepID=A0ABM1EBC6_PRICU|nr:PREDICTED: rab3 GTPase-activating protein non-catalytic subunit-like [Priapulus caudatus]
MSCQLNTVASCSCMREVKECLFPDLIDENDVSETDNSDWEDWMKEGREDSRAARRHCSRQKPKPQSWFQDSIISLSPSKDLLVFGYRDTVAFLAAKWDEQESRGISLKFNIVWSGVLALEEKEQITTITCLPLASQKKSSHGSPDWTCVIVGFSSGYVRIYTETGALLLSQLLHEEPVQRLKCRTHEPRRHAGIPEQVEELTILYPKALVVIEGFSLYQALRACRNQVAKAAASGSEFHQLSPLTYKKWGLNDQDVVNDYVSCGLIAVNEFNQLRSTSLLGGHDAAARPSAAAASLYVATGVAPYVGFFYAVDGGGPPMLSDVAMAVASKLRTALRNQVSSAGSRYLGGWLGIGKKSPTDEQQPPPRIEPATQLPISICSDKNSRRARDLYLLKELKSLIKDNITNSDDLQRDIVTKLSVIRTAGIRQQGLERVLTVRYMDHDSLDDILSSMLRQLDSHEIAAGAVEEKILHHYCHLHQQLLRTYRLLCLLSEGATVHTQDSPNNTSESLSALLNAPVSEVEEAMSALSGYRATRTGVRVSFMDKSSMNVTQFLKCFHGNPSSHDNVNMEILPIMLNKEVSVEGQLELGAFLYEQALAGKCSVISLQEALQKSGIQPENLFTLLVNYWLSKEDWNFTATEYLYAILKHLCSMQGQEDAGGFSDWWRIMRTACSRTTNIASALPAALVGRSVSNLVEGALTKPFNSIPPPGEQPKSDSEWLDVSSDNELWSLLLRQLHNLLFLCTVFRSKPHLEERAEPVSLPEILLSVDGVLHSGRGAITELVAKWVAKVGATAKAVSVALRGSMDASLSESQVETRQDSMSMDQDAAEQQTDETLTNQEDSISALLGRTMLRFPHSLAHDMVLANCCWEYVVQWNKDLEAVVYVMQAIEHLKLVRNGILQHGVGAMVWHTFFQEKFKAAAYLIDKVGKAPKDRLCRKELGISDHRSLRDVIGQCCVLLDIIRESQAVKDNYAEPETDVDMEEIPVYGVVEDAWMDCQGPTPLVELAIDQRPTNYDLVSHHHQLATVLHAILVYELKSVRPLSLYDSKGKNALFTDLHTHPVMPYPEVDATVTDQRLQFLSKLISAAVRALPTKAPQDGATVSVPAAYDMMDVDTGVTQSKGDDDDAPPSSRGGRSSKAAATLARLDASQWYGAAMVLTQAWLGVDVDALRRQHVRELYCSGYDRLAEEVLLTVSDHSEMGSQLLRVAGQRLAHAMLQGSSISNYVSHCSTKLISWLSSMDYTSLRVADVPCEDTAILVSHVINQLPETHEEYDLAVELVEVVHS